MLSDIRNGLRALSSEQGLVQLAKVKSVDRDRLTCACELLNTGLEVFGVSLTAKEGAQGFVLFPEIESFVLLGKIENQNNFYIAFFSEVEKAMFHGGEFGGLVKIEVLVERLNAIEAAFNELLSAFKSHNHAHPQGPTTALISASSQSDLGQSKRSDLENKKVVH